MPPLPSSAHPNSAYAESGPGHKDISAVTEGPLCLDEGKVHSLTVTTKDGGKDYTGSGQRVIAGARVTVVSWAGSLRRCNSWKTWHLGKVGMSGTGAITISPFFI